MHHATLKHIHYEIRIILQIEAKGIQFQPQKFLKKSKVNTELPVLTENTHRKRCENRVWE